MKITITHKGTTITIDESDNSIDDKTSIEPRGTANDDLIKQTIEIIIKGINNLQD